MNKYYLYFIFIFILFSCDTQQIILMDSTLLSGNPNSLAKWQSFDKLLKTEGQIVIMFSYLKLGNSLFYTPEGKYIVVTNIDYKITYNNGIILAEENGVSAPYGYIYITLNMDNLKKNHKNIFDYVTNQGMTLTSSGKTADGTVVSTASLTVPFIGDGQKTSRYLKVEPESSSVIHYPSYDDGKMTFNGLSKKMVESGVLNENDINKYLLKVYKKNDKDELIPMGYWGWNAKKEKAETYSFQYAFGEDNNVPLVILNYDEKSVSEMLATRGGTHINDDALVTRKGDKLSIKLLAQYEKRLSSYLITREGFPGYYEEEVNGRVYIGWRYREGIYPKDGTKRLYIFKKPRTALVDTDEAHCDLVDASDFLISKPMSVKTPITSSSFYFIFYKKLKMKTIKEYAYSPDNMLYSRVKRCVPLQNLSYKFTFLPVENGKFKINVSVIGKWSTAHEDTTETPLGDLSRFLFPSFYKNKASDSEVVYFELIPLINLKYRLKSIDFNKGVVVAKSTDFKLVEQRTIENCSHFSKTKLSLGKTEEVTYQESDQVSQHLGLTYKSKISNVDEMENETRLKYTMGFKVGIGKNSISIPLPTVSFSMSFESEAANSEAFSEATTKKNRLISTHKEKKIVSNTKTLMIGSKDSVDVLPYTVTSLALYYNARPNVLFPYIAKYEISGTFVGSKKSVSGRQLAYFLKQIADMTASIVEVSDDKVIAFIQGERRGAYKIYKQTVARGKSCNSFEVSDKKEATEDNNKGDSSNPFQRL